MGISCSPLWGLPRRQRTALAEVDHIQWGSQWAYQGPGLQPQLRTARGARPAPKPPPPLGLPIPTSFHPQETACPYSLPQSLRLREPQLEHLPSSFVLSEHRV